LGESVFRLPNLGRTVSHKINAENLRKDALNEVEDDPKARQMMAKAAFLSVDEKTMKAFREQGATPKIGRSNEAFLIKGELAPELVKPSSNSPLS
jgi:hypothetical protein